MTAALYLIGILSAALLSLHLIGRAQYRGLKHSKERNGIRASLFRREIEARWKDEVEQ